MKPNLNKLSDVRTQDLQIAVRNRMTAVVEARMSEMYARKELNEHLVAQLPLMGLGKDALVEHVQADCTRGGMSADRAVVSQVRNAFASDDGQRVMLRIIVGAAKGGLTSSYSDLDVTKVQHIVVSSEKSFA